MELNELGHLPQIRNLYHVFLTWNSRCFPFNIASNEPKLSYKSLPALRFVGSWIWFTSSSILTESIWANLCYNFKNNMELGTRVDSRDL